MSSEDTKKTNLKKNVIGSLGQHKKFDTLLASWYPTYMQSFIISHSSCAEQYGDMSSDTRTHTHTQLNHQRLVSNQLAIPVIAHPYTPPIDPKICTVSRYNSKSILRMSDAKYYTSDDEPTQDWSSGTTIV